MRLKNVGSSHVSGRGNQRSRTEPVRNQAVQQDVRVHISEVVVHAWRGCDLGEVSALLEIVDQDQSVVMRGVDVAHHGVPGVALR